MKKGMKELRESETKRERANSFEESAKKYDREEIYIKKEEKNRRH